MSYRREDENKQPSREDLVGNGDASLSFILNGSATLLPQVVEIPTIHSMPLPRPTEHIIPQDPEVATWPKHEGIGTLKVHEAIAALSPHEQKTMQEYLHSLSPEQRKDTIDRIKTLVLMAEQTFAPHIRRYAKTRSEEDLHAFEQSYFDWFALVVPYLDEKSAWMQEVEERTGLKNVNEEKIWPSQNNFSRYLTREEVRNNPKLKADVELWQGTGGLPIHTAAASWGVERFTRLIQQSIQIRVDRGEKLEKHQKDILEIDPSLMRIWLDFHDVMRTLTHDPFIHGAALPMFGHLLNIPEEFYHDYDLPEILCLKENDPKSHNGGITPLEIPDYIRNNPEAVKQVGIAYIDHLLTKLPQRIGHETPAPAVVFFWIVDAYSKLQQFHQLDNSMTRTPPGISDYAFPRFDTLLKQMDESETSYLQQEAESGEKLLLRGKPIAQFFQDQRALLEGLYKNVNFTTSGRQPNDTNGIFTGRYLYRSNQSGSNRDDLYNYYSRQNDLAFGVFNWITERKVLGNQDTWKFFIELTEMSLKLLDPKDHFAYHWTSASQPFLPWNKPPQPQP